MLLNKGFVSLWLTSNGSFAQEAGYLEGYVLSDVVVETGEGGRQRVKVHYDFSLESVLVQRSPSQINYRAFNILINLKYNKMSKCVVTPLHKYPSLHCMDNAAKLGLLI